MIDLILLAVTLAMSGVILWRATDRTGPRLYRVMAVELLLILAFQTRLRWFAPPLSTSQMIFWGFVLAGGTLVGLGFAQRPVNPPQGHPTLTATDEPFLPAQQGVYKIVRHPFYAAALFVGWGLFAMSLTPFDNSSLLYACLFTSASLFLVSAARADETTDYLKYGAPYALYVKTSKMLIPFVL